MYSRPYWRYLIGKWGRGIAALGGLALAGLIAAGCTGASGEAGSGPTATLTQIPTYSQSPAAVEEMAPEDPTATVTPDAAPLADEAEAEMAATAVPTQVPTPTATLRPTFDALAWVDMPVMPELSPHALAILQGGVAMGNNPRAFAKIGDCESRTTWFLGDFDLDEQYYSLGPYEEELAPVIDYYRGSFNRLSMAAKPGFTAASLLSPIWADREACEKGESPLECEYRLHQPALAFIMIGTNDAVNPKTFEGHMRKVIEISLEHRVLPVLGTKADNIEGDHSINATLARLAYEYDVPLWNYWLAVQDLPGRGLQEDGAHLTFAAPHFDNPAALKRAWPVRNLQALQILRQILDATE